MVDIATTVGTESHRGSDCCIMGHTSNWATALIFQWGYKNGVATFMKHFVESWSFWRLYRLISDYRTSGAHREGLLRWMKQRKMFVSSNPKGEIRSSIKQLRILSFWYGRDTSRKGKAREGCLQAITTNWAGLGAGNTCNWMPIMYLWITAISWCPRGTGRREFTRH